MAAPKGTRPPAAGKGRPKGARNKVSRELKEMILAALDKAGGEQYFVEQANRNPVAFLTLLGKVCCPNYRSSKPGTRQQRGKVSATGSFQRQFARSRRSAEDFRPERACGPN